MKRSALLGLVLMMTWSIAPAQQQTNRKWATNAASTSEKLPIEIKARADDDIGKGFVYELRSEIARSGTYRLAETNEVPLFQVRVLTLSLQSDEGSQPTKENNHSVAASVIILLPQTNGSPRFLDAVLFVVGRDRTSATAKQAMVRIDEDGQLAMRGLKRDLP